jgi:hypothetical protein
VRRLVNTSAGWIEIAFSDDQRYASLLLVDPAGWVVGEDEWDDWDRTLTEALAGLGVPEVEARDLAEQTEREWLARGGVAPRESPWWDGIAMLGVLLGTIGVWLAGLVFLLVLVARWMT